jgi:hypothetical protein
MFNLKSILIVAVASGSGLILNAPSAMAYAQHEHPFAKVPQLSQMSQQQADQYCRVLFPRMLSTSRYGRWVTTVTPPRRTSYWLRELPSLKVCPPYLSSRNVNHVWAHRNNGECIANVN